MSVEFNNAYQEILLDNMMAVIKQNFIFQTQLKLSENSLRELTDFKNKFDELNHQYNSVREELSKIEIYKNKAEQNNSAHEEKSRIQAALNDEMKKSLAQQKLVETLSAEKEKLEKEKDNEIESLKLYIQKLEEITPISKLKKVNPQKVFEEKSDSPKIEKVGIEKVLDGSSF